MKIRKAIKSDFEKYLKLKREEEVDYFRIIKQKSKKIPEKEYCKEFLDLINKRDNFLFIAEENKELLGVINGRIIKYGVLRWAEIDILYVLKKFRKKGVGKELINKSQKYAREKKCKKIKLEVNKNNKNALRTYEKEGFFISKYKMEKRLRWK